MDFYKNMGRIEKWLIYYDTQFHVISSFPNGLRVHC